MLLMGKNIPSKFKQTNLDPQDCATIPKIRYGTSISSRVTYPDPDPDHFAGSGSENVSTDQIPDPDTYLAK